jgi:tetratricopeptide (TPR) repeat protein
VVISGVTHRLVQGLFECQDRGLQELKGISTPLPLYRVVREGTAQSRFEVAVTTGLTPLVGREEELALLRRRWEQATEGEGQVVLLSGEAGIGKSRLVQTLKEQVIIEGATRIEFRCSPYHQNSAFYPVIEHLQRVLQFTRDDSAEQKLDKLEQVLSRSRLDLQETVPLLASLLSLPASHYTLPAFSPQKQKEKTQAALVAWLIEETEQKPVYNTWEDVHWADPSTLEVLNLVVDQAPTARLYVLLTFRPEFTPPWGNRSYLSQMTLNRLGRQHVETMVEKVTRGKALPSEVVQQIVAKTDGVPLFVEELTKMVLESEAVGARRAVPLQSLGIPATLQDALMARLDRLGTAKETAQLGATLGREFSYDLLQTLSPLTAETLQQGLRQLVEAELVYQSGVPPQARYLFKHALVQETAYQSLLKSRRQQLHQQIAQVLEGRFSETKETQPELLAYHYTEAGLTEQAIPYWQRAGQRAIERSAYVEAVAHLTKGLELLKTLPDTPERVQQELTLQLALCDALVTVKGYTAPDVEKTLTRARELCQHLGETPHLVPVLWRLFLFYIIRRELQTTLELSERLLRLAQSVQDRYHLSAAHACLGITLYWLGELTLARTHLEQAIALYDPQKHPRPTVNTADPRVDCLSYASWTLWHLGYPDQGLKRSHEALALAEGLSHPFSLAYALGFAAWFHSFRREGPLARERAEALITLSTEQGFPFWLAVGMGVRSWTLAEQGQVQEGIAQMRQSRAPYALALLAEVYGKAGQVEEGLSALTEALAVMNKTGERVWEAELYRLKGELTLQKFQVSGFKFKKVRSPRSEVRSRKQKNAS